MITDTHCHLDLERFDPDREEVLNRAWQAGVGCILIPALDIPSCERVLELVEQDKRLFAAIGVHPNSAKSWQSDTHDMLKQMAAHPKVVAIGEIGLDYYWDHAPHALQKQILQKQLELAGELELPVVIHNREASQDLIPLAVSWQQKLVSSGSPLAGRPGVFHSWSASSQDAKKVLDANYFIGITGPVTFKNAPDLQALAASLPLSRLLIETDSPFLSPHPKRGKRNEPANVRLVAEKIAELKAISFDQAARQTTENAGRLFRWKRT